MIIWVPHPEKVNILSVVNMFITGPSHNLYDYKLASVKIINQPLAGVNH